MSSHQQSVQITITDIAGKKIILDKRTLAQGKNDLRYSTIAWAKGVYIVKTSLQDGTSTSVKIIK